ncbi:hypothetical protein SHI21_02755 [Bacteriovorax sp. PP10]|uniref:Lipoprotein n=1 Tax=Bacteriovorax antarcticus TaxID=3088717 RepID=A0ABU5VSV5_9BACT|nr:hypothetical protein [Bacteriovorax sp. PP10]MEA9355100.1 hypothetical protein [Bacteriovorax sp. PP10]
MTKKSTMVLNLLVLSSLGLLVTGCSEPDGKKAPLSKTEANKLEELGKKAEAAEMYSRIGEILLSKPEGIIHAQAMFKKSLELNAHDGKANIYSSVLSPLLTTKGFLNRFGDLLQKEAKTDINASKEKLAKMNVQEFTELALVMPAGKASAKNAEDLRKFIRQEYVQELGASIKKLENIKAEKTVLSYLDISRSYSVTTSESRGTMDDAAIEREVEHASTVSNKQFVVDNYDIKALKIILKSQKNALTIASSIGLTGFEEVAAKIKSTSAKTDKQIIAAIRTQPNLFKIDGSKEDLKDIFDHTEEVMNDLIDFSKISKEVCGAEDRKENLASNVCVTEASADKINELLMFVVGPKSVLIGYDANNEEVLVDVNLRGLIDSRVSSLQELLPTKFDSKGRAVDVADQTFGGIIPNGDLISKFKTVIK